MAKVKKNVVIKGLSGTLGDQLVLKRDKAGRTIVSVKPTFPDDREFTEAQKEQIEDFREATQYAKAAAREAVRRTWPWRDLSRRVLPGHKAGILSGIRDWGSRNAKVPPVRPGKGSGTLWQE